MQPLSLSSLSRVARLQNVDRSLARVTLIHYRDRNSTVLSNEDGEYRVTSKEINVVVVVVVVERPARVILDASSFLR